MAIELSKEFVISNKLGLHARPATRFANTANRFKCEVIVKRDDITVNGKSILGLLTLGAAEGTPLQIVTRGADAEAAMQAFEQLFASDHIFNHV